MRRVFVTVCVLLFVAAQYVAPAHAAETLDLRRGVPHDAYLVYQSMHNPERDFQKKYYNDVWKTVQDTQIIERALNIITSRMGDDELAQAGNVMEELREATKSIDIQTLANCQEMIYAGQMGMWQVDEQAPSMPTSQHLVLLRLTPDAAASVVEGMKNLFAIAEKYTQGEVEVESSQKGNASVVTMKLAQQFPMQPTVAQLGEVLIVCSSKDLLEKSLGMMTDEPGTSKFDDPRLAAALARLPKAEDSLLFYDGRAQFAAMSELGPSLAQIGGGDPNVQVLVEMVDMVMEELAVFDHEVTVGYTEGNLNRTATYGRLVSGTEDSTIRKMMYSGEPFEPWQAWVPAGSLSYSLGTGVNLHTLYERITEVLKEKLPEAKDGLAQFELIQEQFDLHLDRDILQAFSGEYASVSVVTDNGKRESVMALRCHKPDRIKELIHRGIEAALQNDWVQMQQLKLVESNDLEGFEAVSATLLGMFGQSPVIGFQDGWMYIGQSSAAVKKVLETKAGNGETIENTDAFQRLNMDIEGPVRSIKYANTAENLRAIGDALRKASFTFQMVTALAGANAQDEALEPVKEVLALLPAVARVLEKFDFLEATITVVQDGDDADSYSKRSVIVVRPAEAGDAEI